MNDNNLLADNSLIAAMLADTRPATLPEECLADLSGHDADCWRMYFGGTLPAGGLHLSYAEWLAGRESAHPRNVAAVLNEVD